MKERQSTFSNPENRSGSHLPLWAVIQGENRELEVHMRTMNY